MSIILGSPYRKPACGEGMFNSGLMDVLGGFIDLQILGTDPDVVGPISGPYIPDAGQVNPDGTFLINIETDNGIYIVELMDGTQFTITAVQSHAYLGQWYPAKLLQVLAGTTGSFSVGY
jgi:hypothetical protein